MPVTPSYPGVYIEELPSGVRTITGVATSITAFIGRARQGPVNEPVMVRSFGEFERVFGGLWLESTLSYAVRHFFANGGSDALIVRIHNGANKASLAISGALALEAKNEGSWANTLKLVVDHNTKDPADTSLFNLKIQSAAGETLENFPNASSNPANPRYVVGLLERESRLWRVSGSVSARPAADTYDMADPTPPAGVTITAGGDGNALTLNQYTGSQANKTGVYALLKADLFNLLCVPPPSFTTDFADGDWDNFYQFCQDRRALLIVDAPRWADSAAAVSGIAGFTRHRNAAIFFPRVRAPDPLRENRLEEFVPCGAVAGVMARTDASRGIWKAPAGLEATLNGVAELSVSLTDKENGDLNVLGVNCLRALPNVGRVVWGARTLEGADRLASEWKYIPVRRMALYLEESLYRGLQWVVFEPNDEPLWAQIRLNVGAFLHNLFRQGAFAGTTPREAYFVKCDKETTTQDDVNRGVVNILVGFAPLKPAEFVIVKLQQMAGQVQA